MRPKPDGVAVTLIQRQPCDGALGPSPDPLFEQHRLARTGRRDDKGELAARTFVQQALEPWAPDGERRCLSRGQLGSKNAATSPGPDRRGDTAPDPGFEGHGSPRNGRE